MWRDPTADQVEGGSSLVDDDLPFPQHDFRLEHLVQVEHRFPSTRMMAASAVLAPVTMLRVYCTWPGVSAMMNLRRAVAKQR